MDLSKYILLKVLTVILLFSQYQTIAQTKAIIIDAETKIPIPFVNIYTKNGAEIIGTSSNNEGIFVVNFTFNELIFKHINYNDIRINKTELKDTVYLHSKANILNEVIIKGTQKTWITKLLKDVVKEKQKNYARDSTYYNYEYKTYSLSDSTGYAFKSNGNLLIPNIFGNKKYAVRPEIGIIRYKDNTAGCDFSNLQKILYDDKFIKEFDNHFIKNYTFQKNSENENLGENIVIINFKSKKYNDDSGSITLDTISKAILEYHRISGTNYNVNTKTNFVYRNFASKVLGSKYKELYSEISVKYTKNNNYYQLSESKLKAYESFLRKKKGKETIQFSSVESELKLKPIQNLKKIQWIMLPTPLRIGIETKNDRLSQQALQKIPKKHTDFSLD